METQFEREEMLIGQDGLAILNHAHVMLFGLGGVGGACAEALVRGGIGHLSLVDPDTVALSNLNRQAFALHSTIGMKKTDAAELRLHDISPDTVLTKLPYFFCAETLEMFDFSHVDYVVDAIDTVTAKLLLYAVCKEKQIPVISAMGTGNKTDPTRLRVSDISETKVCPLARVIRGECKKRGIEKLKVLWSDEEPHMPKYRPQKPDNAPRRDTPGSISFMPPTAGMMLAGALICDLLQMPSRHTGQNKPGLQ